MKQVLFRIPGLGLPVYGFGLMVVVAFYAGMSLAAWRSRRERLDPAVIHDLALWVLLGGLAGARLLYVAEYWGETVHTAGDILRVWQGGLDFYGGAFGAAAGLALCRLARRFPVLATLDALAPSVALGVAIGRVGCFLNGCCYGDYCDVPWLAVEFPRGSPPWVSQRVQGLIPAAQARSLPLHPAQLYAALNGLILLALLSTYYPLRRRDGDVFGLLLLTYPVSRFLLERLRNDEQALFAGMTTAQVISLGVLAAASAFRAFLATRPARRPAGGP